MSHKFSKLLNKRMAHDTRSSTVATTVRYRIDGMDCSSCAQKIEQAVKEISGVLDVKVAFASQLMTLRADNQPDTLREAERAVAALGYHLTPLASKRETAEADEDEVPKQLTPSYRSALWTVALLNIGYGAIEIVAGFIAGSQALKADALDFLGDGLITLLGLLAIGWSSTWRATSALAQGLFLGAMGIGVLSATIYSVFVLNQPEAELMGIFGMIALGINVTAALILIPHRSGDANVRAVWLFSRNDAIGNVAVVIAAVFVAWTGTPWPDLIVALVIAILFLHSSWSIIRDARSELSTA